MPSTDLPRYFPLADNGKEFYERGGNKFQYTYPEILSEESPLGYSARMEFYGVSSDDAYVIKYLATNNLSTSQYRAATDYITTQATTPREDTIQKIEKLAQTAAEDNWDGEGAIKVSWETIEVACKLVTMFPQNVLHEDVDIDVTPLGSIDFGWVLERDVMMNIIVLPSGEIGFAYSVHGARGGGKEPWEGTTIRSVSEAFNRVFSRHGFGD